MSEEERAQYHEDVGKVLGKGRETIVGYKDLIDEYQGAIKHMLLMRNIIVIQLVTIFALLIFILLLIA